MPQPLFTPRKDPVPIVQEAEWAPGPVWTVAENLAPTRIRSPGLPACTQSPYRLRYPAHIQNVVHDFQMYRFEIKLGNPCCVRGCCVWCNIYYKICPLFFCIIVALVYHVLDTCWANEFNMFIFGLYFPADERWLSLRNYLHSKFLRCFIFVSVFCYNMFCPPWHFNCCLTNECRWYIRSILPGGRNA